MLVDDAMTMDRLEVVEAVEVGRQVREELLVVEEAEEGGEGLDLKRFDLR